MTNKKPSTKPAAYLVESIPRGMDDLRVTPGVKYTENVLVDLTKNAEETIDLTAMYWALLADPESADEKGFTEDELLMMGADTGKDLYQALLEAAERGVKIRIIEAPGFAASGANEAPPPQESEKLKAHAPNNVEIHQITMGDWYGGSGIMHQKIWIFDQRDLYIGSANMDWKSIAQVKEMGVAVENARDLADDLAKYFDCWWKFTGQTHPTVANVLDAKARITRTVPSWSCLVPKDERSESPLDDESFSTEYTFETPLTQEFNGEDGAVCITGAPEEIRGRGRTWDGAGLVKTIDDAQHSICLSVMDLAPISLYGSPAKTPVWWPDLFDALLSAALARKVYVRLLVSNWAHTSPLVAPLLETIQQAAQAGRGSPYLSSGQLEVKQFVIPGWDSTTGRFRKYPGHTRVNHTKYIVTDRRVNIGTSNMTWDYFSSTAGSSFNATHEGLVDTLQAVFDRDWASSYAYPLGTAPR